MQGAGGQAGCKLLGKGGEEEEVAEAELQFTCSE